MSKGGKRTGAGRKPCTDKKVQVSLYVRKSIIDRFGNETFKNTIYKLIDKL